MAITTESIIESVLESLEWAYQNNELHAHDSQSTLDRITEWTCEAVDSALVYTSEIWETWIGLGSPEPEEYADTIADSITRATYEALCGDIYPYDVIDRFLESHAATLETLDVVGEWEESLAALIEYRETL